MVLLDMGIMFLFLEVLVDRKFFSHMLVTISDLGKIVNKIKNLSPTSVYKFDIPVGVYF